MFQFNFICKKIDFYKGNDVFKFLYKNIKIQVKFISKKKINREITFYKIVSKMFQPFFLLITNDMYIHTHTHTHTHTLSNFQSSKSF